VGILTRNGGKTFARVLDALGEQTTPWPFEIVVLDSASKDGSDVLAQQHGARVEAYRPAKFRFGMARDRLFEICRGQVVVTISQDVVPAAPSWLETLVSPILAGQAEACVGAQLPPPGTYSFYWDYHGSWLRSVAVAFDQAYGQIAISCSDLALSRATWEKLRFGDVEAIEDRGLQIKMHQSGCRMKYVAQALSFHGHDYTWKELFNRNGSFAMGWAQLGWPYTGRRLLRDLMQPNRYLIAVDAFMQRKLVSWKALIFPVAMCFIQYLGSRKKKWN
jgi:rhamnosyltransferase